MEGGIEAFFNPDFDLLGMSFPEEGNEGTCAPFSRYAAADYDWANNVGADFEVPAVACVSLPGVYEDYSYFSGLVNVVDPTLQWDGSCCVPAADFSGIQDDIVTGNSQVPNSDQVMPTEENFVAEKGSKRKRKSLGTEDTEEIIEKPKKRPRQCRVSLQKRQENNATRKRKKPTNMLGKEACDDDKNVYCDDNVIGRQDGQSSLRACSSEVDLDSQPLSNSNGMEDSLADENPSAAEVRPRASRAAATDPQSLYARRRREKINERLKILQNLIPNGTKVDISTMLEEAVHYVKFLQVQIKLLSSDDLWKYAPVAYNGKDIGLDMNQLFQSRS